MTLNEVLVFIIEDGKEAAKQSYTRPCDQLKLEGSLRGFDDCHQKSIQELTALLRESNEAAQVAMHTEASDYWYWRCRSLEIAWVCNVVGNVLMAQGVPLIDGSILTARGAMKAAEIIGVAD